MAMAALSVALVTCKMCRGIISNGYYLLYRTPTEGDIPEAKHPLISFPSDILRHQAGKIHLETSQAKKNIFNTLSLHSILKKRWSLPQVPLIDLPEASWPFAVINHIPVSRELRSYFLFTIWRWYWPADGISALVFSSQRGRFRESLLNQALVSDNSAAHCTAAGSR